MRNRQRVGAGKRIKTHSFDEVVRLASDLPGVERSTAYGSPALKVNGKMFACIPTHRSAEPDSLAHPGRFHRDLLHMGWRFMSATRPRVHRRR